MTGVSRCLFFFFITASKYCFVVKCAQNYRSGAQLQDELTIMWITKNHLILQLGWPTMHLAYSLLSPAVIPELIISHIHNSRPTCSLTKISET